MMTECNIRPARDADLDAIILLWEEFMDFHKQRDQRFTRARDGSLHFRSFIAGHLASATSCELVECEIKT